MISLTFELKLPDSHAAKLMDHREHVAAILAAREAQLPAEEVAEINNEHVMAEEARQIRIAAIRKKRSANARLEKQKKTLEKLQKKLNHSPSRISSSETPSKAPKNISKKSISALSARRFSLTPLKARYKPRSRTCG